MSDTTTAPTASDTTDTTSALPPPPPPPVATDEPLGPEGEKALQIWKDRAKAAEAEAKRVGELQSQLDAVNAERMTEQEKAIEAARKEADAAARAEVLGTVNDKLFAAEVRAAARAADIPAADGKTVRLADPSLLDDPEVARRLLGLAEIPVTDSGDIDAGAISAAVAALAASKPSLTASAMPAPGSADQGARTPPAVKDINAQIVDAETAGDWALAGQLKLQKLAALPQP